MVLAMRVVIALALALILPTPAVWGQHGGQPANGSFRVNWELATDRMTPRIEGRVHNDSRYRVTDVRLHVEGFNADGQPVGRTFAWALGDIRPGDETSFVVACMRDAVTYRIKVNSFDLVSEGQVP